MPNDVKKLDAECASKIRKSQVITKVSDVVRELVDNSIDSGARSIQILLENYGLKKIEVKDSGNGINATDIGVIFQGGYTSKLKDESHLSCDNQYGFRGEALGAICSFGGMTVVTKTPNDMAAKKYVLNKHGKIVTENPVALPNGTIITIRELFSDFPVRYKYSSDPKVCRNELKEIQAYLKSLSIANASVYVALHHNGNLIWSKPSVKTTEQAITTVLGIALAKKIAKCPFLEFTPEQNENENTSWKGKLELFVPEAPVDMKSVGFTNNKMTMIFVNRRRVLIDDYEKLIKRYAVGAATNPSQTDQRKYPAAICMIEVPPTEVDFNRDMDKSKVFLCCHDLILRHLEEMLQSFYGIDLNFLSPSQESVANDTIASANNSEVDGSVLNSTESDLGEGSLLNTSTSSASALSPPEKNSVRILDPPVSTPEKRKENIMSFLGDLPKSTNFSKCNANTNFSGVSPTTPKSAASSSKISFTNQISTAVTNFEALSNQNKEGYNHEFKTSEPIANFTLSTLSESQSSFGTNAVARPAWDSFSSNGSLFQQSLNEETGRQAPMSIDSEEDTRANNFLLPAPSNTSDDSHLNIGRQLTSPSPSMFTLSGFSKPKPNSEQDDDGVPQCGAILHTNNSASPAFGSRLSSSFRSSTSYAPFPKKPKLFEIPGECSSIFEAGGRKPRQVTLESLKNWNNPSKPNCGNKFPSIKPPTLKNTVDIPPEDMEIDESLIPNTLAYLQSKHDSSLDANNKPDTDNITKSSGSDSTNSTTQNDLGLLGLQASVSLAPLKAIKSSQQVNRSDLSVISQLEDSKYYIVKVDGLLGVFNPQQVLVLRPHLEYKLPSTYTATGKNSHECISFLLGEFTHFSNLLEKEAAARVFQVLADLQEFEEANRSDWFPVPT